MNKMLYLCNGFSTSMCVDKRIKRIDEPITAQEFLEIILNNEFKSAIGHEALARCLSRITGRNIERNRLNLHLTYDDIIILVSLKGRLPEHPTLVQYKNKLIYSIVRFEKQTLEDTENSLKLIETLKRGEI